MVEFSVLGVQDEVETMQGEVESLPTEVGIM
jgi:hypothetical protein